jgi:hypothetical protein
MTEAEATTARISPPWEPQDIFTEDALRAAQEYWFQTHATNSRMIAEGRAATGFMKSHIRRKLEREMGEDFKMYTGQQLGTGADGAEESAGIRGELNQALGWVYSKVAAGKPITSPLQEDVAILAHPLGGVEICYAMVHYYTNLMQRYATLAGNRRKVLKSILDEELFKWVWRSTIAFLLSKDKRKFDLSQSILSTGLKFIPLDRQRATSAEKVLEVGQFLIGKLISESHLRFPLIFYFNTYCRVLQFQLLSQYPPQQCETLYNGIVGRKRGDGCSDVIVAIDEIMNTTGNSGQSFEDVLKDEELEVEKYIPPGEIEFIGQFREFTQKNLGNSLKRLMPKNVKPGVDGAASLMSLLLILRTLPSQMRTRVLEKVPGPMLSLFGNRITNGQQDDVSRVLAGQIKEMVDTRAKSGETYTLIRQEQSAHGVKTVRPAADAGKEAAGAPAGPAAQAAVPGAVAPQAGTPHAAHAATTHAAAPRPVMETPGASGAGEGGSADEPLIVDWQVDAGKLKLEAISARDLIRLTGPEVRALVQFVKFALQTGQLFRVPPGNISKETMEGLIGRLLKSAPGDIPPVLSKEERLAILEAGKNQSAKQFLATLVKKLRNPPQPRGSMQPALNALLGKLGARLPSFVANPGGDGSKEVVQGLSAEERQAVSTLARVSKTA